MSTHRTLHRPRRRWAAALALGASLLVGTVAAAQPPGGSPPPAEDARPRGPMLSPERIDRHVRELTEHVHLDARQQRQVRAILQSAADEVQGIRDDTQPRSHERFEARRELMWRVDDQIWALLRCDQKDAFRLFQREMHHRRMEAHRRGRGHGHGHGHGPHGGGGPRRGRQGGSPPASPPGQ